MSTDLSKLMLNTTKETMEFILSKAEREKEVLIKHNFPSAAFFSIVNSYLISFWGTKYIRKNTRDEMIKDFENILEQVCNSARQSFNINLDLINKE